MPIMVLCRWHRHHQDCEHKGGKQPEGRRGHDSSHTHGYLSGDAPMTTGIPVVQKKQKNKRQIYSHIKIFACWIFIKLHQAFSSSSIFYVHSSQRAPASLHDSVPSIKSFQRKDTKDVLKNATYAQQCVFPFCSTALSYNNNLAPWEGVQTAQ